MKMRNFAHLLLIPCLLLCSCHEDETEPESMPAEPSILDCPPEDIAEYPVLDEPSPPSSSSGELMAGFCTPPKLSVEELLFGTQGGVRCVTSTHIGSAGTGYKEGNPVLNCRSENIIVSDTVNKPPHFLGVTRFKRLICPWFTATLVDNRTLHISVNKNETGNDRETVVVILAGNCGASFKIAQSPN